MASDLGICPDPWLNSNRAWPDSSSVRFKTASSQSSATDAGLGTRSRAHSSDNDGSLPSLRFATNENQVDASAATYPSPTSPTMHMEPQTTAAKSIPSQNQSGSLHAPSHSSSSCSSDSTLASSLDGCEEYVQLKVIQPIRLQSPSPPSVLKPKHALSISIPTSLGKNATGPMTSIDGEFRFRQFNQTQGMYPRLSLPTTATTASCTLDSPFNHEITTTTTTTSTTMNTNFYPNGPVLVDEPQVYLFSEPSAEIAAQFDLVINVAREVAMPHFDDQGSPGPRPQYIHVPWDHNASSTLCNDLAWLTSLIEERALKRNQRVLIHCQCGVSRSASLVVAYVMKRHGLDLNSAYTLVKQRCPHISPNMTLMFQLMEWAQMTNSV